MIGMETSRLVVAFGKGAYTNSFAARRCPRINVNSRITAFIFKS